MIKKEKFNNLVDLAMQIEGRGHMRAVIEKELLHYDILFALEKEQLLETLTFQGGTCLRLCYGAFRLSEDLDFTGGKDFSATKLLVMKQCLEHYLGERYGLEVSVKEPKEMAKEPEYAGLKIDKWRISIVTAPERKDLPKQKIKVEVANIDSYTHTPRAIQHNYDFLPDGYDDVIIMAETLDEIMADKVISLANCDSYVRYRDIWDLRWLKQQGATLSADYVNDKITDYAITDYMDKLMTMRSRLNDIVNSHEFQHEMSRFIPLDIQQRTLEKAHFKELLSNEVDAILLDVSRLIA